MNHPEVGEEPSVGELVGRLVEDGRAYARAEARLWRTVASERGKALGLPAALLFTALLFAQGGVTALCVATFFALLPLVGALGAGLLTLLLALAIAAALAWIAYGRIRRSWR